MTGFSAETVHELEVLAGWHNVEISWWGEWQEREGGMREYIGHHFRVRWGDYQINRLFDEDAEEFIIIFGVKDMIKYLEYLTKGKIPPFEVCVSPPPGTEGG